MTTKRFSAVENPRPWLHKARKNSAGQLYKNVLSENAVDPHRRQLSSGKKLRSSRGGDRKSAVAVVSLLMAKTELQYSARRYIRVIRYSNDALRLVKSATSMSSSQPG